MNPNLKTNERELLKLIKFFRKRAEALRETGELTTEAEAFTAGCEKIAGQLETHANSRAAILEKREKLNTMIADNAVCPKCNSSSMLKLSGRSTNEQGWKMNRYKCRRCNIEFTWNRPNNPWDLVPFIEAYQLEVQQVLDQATTEAEAQHAQNMLAQLSDSLEKLKPVLAASDEEIANLEAQELEMSRLIHEFTNYLQIEKIRLNTWDPSKTGL